MQGPAQQTEHAGTCSESKAWAAGSDKRMPLTESVTINVLDFLWKNAASDTLTKLVTPATEHQSVTPRPTTAINGIHTHAHLHNVYIHPHTFQGSGLSLLQP
jgi:hypothetical protein